MILQQEYQLQQLFIWACVKVLHQRNKITYPDALLECGKKILSWMQFSQAGMSSLMFYAAHARKYIINMSILLKITENMISKYWFMVQNCMTNL
jgi:hypothetical protein